MRLVLDAEHIEGAKLYFEYHGKNILAVNLNDNNAFESIIDKISSLPSLNKQSLLYKMLPSTASDFIAALADEITDSTPIQSVTFVKSEESMNSEKEYFKSQTEPKQEAKEEAKEEKPKSEESKPEEPKVAPKEDTPVKTEETKESVPVKEEPKTDTPVKEESAPVEEQKTPQEDVPTPNTEDVQPVNAEEQNSPVVEDSPTDSPVAEETPVNNPEEQHSDSEEYFTFFDGFDSEKESESESEENSSEPTPSFESAPEVEEKSPARDITYYFPDGEGLSSGNKYVDPDILLSKYPSCCAYMRKSHPDADAVAFDSNEVFTYLENEGKCF